ncbi:hypothetical protein WJX75_003898 [Coccomyxa subellipsoidea]|uniref:Mannose-P-dolichol utilization defect 1 protein homolog n=1 Tax=Coccomyxa subellipsoidea TaxID=248742 RepID=A0ABR2Z0A4_9CHLO
MAEALLPEDFRLLLGMGSAICPTVSIHLQSFRRKESGILKAALAGGAKERHRSGPGYCVVAGSFTRSVPQIVRILKNKSVKGISLAAQYAELVAYSITVAYNLDHGYAFSTYGDTAACWVQDVILILLIARYRGNSGELSPVTSGLNLAGNLARTFTTLVLTQDLINLAGTLVQAILNGILVWQSVSSAKRMQDEVPQSFSSPDVKAA